MQFLIISLACCLAGLTSAYTERAYQALSRDLLDNFRRRGYDDNIRHLRPRATGSRAKSSQNLGRIRKLGDSLDSSATDRNPADGNSNSKPKEVKTKMGSPVSAGFSNPSQGVAWIKKDGTKTFYNLPAGGTIQQETHRQKISAGSYGARDRPVMTWARGMNPGVSMNLEPGSKASVKATGVNGNSEVIRYDQPGRTKKVFKSSVPGHHMHVEAELMGPGQIKTKASQ